MGTVTLFPSLCHGNEEELSVLCNLSAAGLQINPAAGERLNMFRHYADYADTFTLRHDSNE